MRACFPVCLGVIKQMNQHIGRAVESNLIVTEKLSFTAFRGLRTQEYSPNSRRANSLEWMGTEGLPENRFNRLVTSTSNDLELCELEIFFLRHRYRFESGAAVDVNKPLFRPGVGGTGTAVSSTQPRLHRSVTVVIVIIVHIAFVSISFDHRSVATSLLANSPQLPVR